MDDLRVSDELTIPAVELRVRFSRAGGPGGQHVNTSATRVEVLWNVAASAALTDDERSRLLAALSNRLNTAGELRVVSGATRSQGENRARALARLAAIVAGALQTPRERTPTEPTAAARARRVATKRRRSETKRRRQAPPAGDGEA